MNCRLRQWSIAATFNACKILECHAMGPYSTYPDKLGMPSLNAPITLQSAQKVTEDHYNLAKVLQMGLSLY